MKPVHGVMMQYFHWYSSSDGSHWRGLERSAKDLAKAGFTALWLPPAYKGLNAATDVGYGVYDMYDLGEFDQRGGVPTRYGSKDEYIAALRSLCKVGIHVYADAVLNHRIGGDEAELVRAIPYSQHDRLNPIGGPLEVRTCTRFTFPGRNGTYSDFTWNWTHFDAVDYDENEPGKRGVLYLFEGKRFDDYVALENGNFSYLMGCDVDFQNPEVRGEIIRWGKWYLDVTGVDGFRLDAIKHISSWFFPEWVDALEKHAGRDLFFVGEYWSSDIAALHWYIDHVGGRMSVFDVPLHFNFHAAGKAGAGYDLRRILDGTLMKERPWDAVTFVENHDSQPLQALESVVEPWFKPLAYALILLRPEGYPCVFFADYYGADYDDLGRDGNRNRIVMPAHKVMIDHFLAARRDHMKGPGWDYFDHPNCIGWTRGGEGAASRAMAVIMSNGHAGVKWMNTGKPGASFSDVTGGVTGRVRANADGWAEFHCPAGSVSLWIQD